MIRYDTRCYFNVRSKADVQVSLIYPEVLGVSPDHYRFFLAPYGWLGSRVDGLRRRRAWVQIAAATLSGDSLRQTVHTHCASVYQAAKLVAAFLRVARVNAGLAESNGSLPPGL